MPVDMAPNVPVHHQHGPNSLPAAHGCRCWDCTTTNPVAHVRAMVEVAEALFPTLAHQGQVTVNTDTLRAMLDEYDEMSEVIVNEGWEHD